MFTPSRIRFSGWATAALACLFAFAHTASAACEWPTTATLFSQWIIFPDRPTVQVRVSVPITSELLLESLPRGIDIQMTVAELNVAADNPVRRFGARTLILSTENRTELLVTLARKEGGGTQGRVLLQVGRLSALGDSACMNAWRSAAAADLHYAKAQSSTIEGASATGVDAKSEYQAAAKEYFTAARAFLSANAKPLAALAQLAVASLDYQNLQQWQESWDASESARADFQSLGLHYEQARALAMRAAAEMELALLKPKAAGSTSTGLSHGTSNAIHLKATTPPAPGPSNSALEMLTATRLTFIQLSRFHAQRGESYDQALALNNAGLTAHYAGHFDQAIATYRRVLPIYRALKDTQRQAQVLQNIALTEFELGRFSLSKRDYGDAIDLIGSSSKASLRGEILNNEAVVEYALGELDAALRHHNEALSILTRAQSERERARTLNGMGSVYYAAGDPEQALEYLSQAVAMRDAKRDPRGRIASLRAEASVLSDLHRYSEAAGLRREALALAVTPSARARIQAQLARDLWLTGDLAEAQTVINAVLEEKGSSLISVALSLLTRADIELSTSSLTEAERDAQAALRVLKDSEAPHEQMAAWSVAARIARARGDWRTALSHIDRALQLAEEVRLESANPELRAGVWQSSRPLFDLKIETLLQAAAYPSTSRPTGKIAPPAPESNTRLALKALAIAEASRARSLADYWRLRRAVTHSADTSASQMESLYQEIAWRRYELEVRRDRAGDDDPRSRAIRADITRLRREIDSQSRLGKTDSTAPLARITERPGPNEIARTVATLPADTTVIEYWLGTPNARAWVATSQGVRMISLGPSEQLDRAARTAHAGLQELTSVSRTERSERIARLSALVIQPLPADALAAHTLVIIPDGALHYIPFGILIENPGLTHRTLVDRHILLTAPSVAALKWPSEARPTPKRVLLVSDPVYSDDDPRLQSSRLAIGVQTRTEDSPSPPASFKLRAPTLNGDFSRLPGTTAEAATILRLVDPRTVDSLSGFDASRTAFLGRNLSQYRIIHVAAHAQSNTEAPQLSALVLSLRNPSGEPISGEVFAGEFLWRPLDADLVVLSACNTALGRESAGEGLLGLRYAVHAAGARSVIASLWQIPDQPSATLMSEFYQHYIGSREPPAQALAEAMRAAEQTYEDPGLWGAYEISMIGPEALHTSH